MEPSIIKYELLIQELQFGRTRAGASPARTLYDALLLQGESCRHHTRAGASPARTLYDAKGCATDEQRNVLR